MRALIALLVIGMLMGCSYSTRFHVGEYGAAHTLSITKHGFE
jgi:hypothetical protein